MYAAVADLKSLVRGVLLIILTLFIQFQRQAYRDVTVGHHLLSTILFELVAVITCAMAGCPAQKHLQKEVGLEMRKQWFC